MNLHANNKEESIKIQEELKEIAKEIFGDSFDHAYPNVVYDHGYVYNGYILEMREYDALTLDQLVALSERVGTKLIDIKYTAEEGDYSEYTPGSPSSFVIHIRER